MKERLPVNYPLASGYDLVEAISSMEVSEPNNSMAIIEEFIDKHFQGNGAYYNNTALAKHPLVFPLG